MIDNRIYLVHFMEHPITYSLILNVKSRWKNYGGDVSEKPSRVKGSQRCTGHRYNHAFVLCARTFDFSRAPYGIYRVAAPERPRTWLQYIHAVVTAVLWGRFNAYNFEFKWNKKKIILTTSPTFTCKYGKTFSTNTYMHVFFYLVFFLYILYSTRIFAKALDFFSFFTYRHIYPTIMYNIIIVLDKYLCSTRDFFRVKTVTNIVHIEKILHLRVCEFRDFRKLFESIYVIILWVCLYIMYIIYIKCTYHNIHRV